MKSPERKVEKKPPRIRGAARRTGVASPIRCRRLRAAIGAPRKAQRAADTERIGKRCNAAMRSEGQGRPTDDRCRDTSVYPLTWTDYAPALAEMQSRATLPAGPCKAHGQARYRAPAGQ